MPDSEETILYLGGQGPNSQMDLMTFWERSNIRAENSRFYLQKALKIALIRQMIFKIVFTRDILAPHVLLPCSPSWQVLVEDIADVLKASYVFNEVIRAALQGLLANTFEILMHLMPSIYCHWDILKCYWSLSNVVFHFHHTLLHLPVFLLSSSLAPATKLTLILSSRLASLSPLRSMITLKTCSFRNEPWEPVQFDREDVDK